MDDFILKKISKTMVLLAYIVFLIIFLPVSKMQAATKPAKPVILLKQGTDGSSVTLTIKKTEKADGYLIYMKSDTDTKYKRVKTLKEDGTAKRTYSLKSLPDGQYSFKVKAYFLKNGKKVKSAYSKVKSIYLKAVSEKDEKEDDKEEITVPETTIPVQSSEEYNEIIGKDIIVFEFEGGELFTTNISETKKEIPFQNKKLMYVYFGRFPQKEIKGDELTADIINARYDINGNTIVDGKIYRRITSKDLDFDLKEWEKNRYQYYDYYDWSDDNYKYFVFEPIKWKVLEAKNGKLILLSDKVIDFLRYSKENWNDAWEKSSIRSWLNGYERDNKAVTLPQSNSEESFVTLSFIDTEKKFLTDIYGGDIVSLIGNAEYLNYCSLGLDESKSFSNYAFAKGCDRRAEKRWDGEFYTESWMGIKKSGDVILDEEDKNAVSFHISNYSHGNYWCGEDDIWGCGICPLIKLDIGSFISDYEDIAVADDLAFLVASGRCGESVSWSYDEENSAINIFGTGSMYNYYYYSSPFYFLQRCRTNMNVFGLLCLNIHEGVTVIGSRAFEGCCLDYYLYIPDSVEEIRASAFSSTTIEHVTGCNNLKRILFQAFGNCSTLQDISLPAVETLSSDAFYRDISLIDVNLERNESMEVLNIGAFSGCKNLENIYIPKNCKEVSGILSACYRLPNMNKYTISEISVHPENTSFCVVDDVLYSKDMKELVFYLPGKADENYVMPNSVVKVCKDSFYYPDNLKSITFSKNVREVESGVFWVAIGEPSIKEDIIFYVPKGLDLTDVMNYGASTTYYPQRGPLNNPIIYF